MRVDLINGHESTNISIDRKTVNNDSNWSNGVHVYEGFAAACEGRVPVSGCSLNSNVSHCKLETVVG